MMLARRQKAKALQFKNAGLVDRRENSAGMRKKELRRLENWNKNWIFAAVHGVAASLAHDAHKLVLLKAT